MLSATNGYISGATVRNSITRHLGNNFNVTDYRSRDPGAESYIEVDVTKVRRVCGTRTRKGKELDKINIITKTSRKITGL